jgi:hypothetical protein
MAVTFCGSGYVHVTRGELKEKVHRNNTYYLLISQHIQLVQTLILPEAGVHPNGGLQPPHNPQSKLKKKTQSL